MEKGEQSEGGRVVDAYKKLLASNDWEQ